MVDGARVGGGVCGVFGRVGAAIHVVSPKVAGSSASLQAGSAVVAERIYPASVQATKERGSYHRWSPEPRLQAQAPAARGRSPSPR